MDREDRFLMHRVELKAPIPVTYSPSLGGVPNAPCGVESVDKPCFFSSNACRS